ncbi:TetR/AcrR family transcriptional regulator [Fructilactobacillus sp. Tb1]|uniref:TetR/AcrR family transcriptional regulator n=1 Tax=Fructilactobacillus sp. Tb1 TaxID=3422304 RepID=UPI003D2B96CB
MTDLRKERTNKFIRESFNQLLTEQPFSKITVAEIVKKAMIHRNTFYQHYDDKYDLLRSCIANMVNDSDFSIEEFKVKPFTTIDQALMTNYPKILDRQANDEDFRHTTNNVLLSSITKKSDHRDIFWVIGKIAAIFIWNEMTNQNYDLINDYQELDEIYTTGIFPN